MGERKLITIRIDPNLDRMWKNMGRSLIERTGEIQELDSWLLQRYHDFIEQTHVKLAALEEQFKQVLEEWKQAQLTYGDKSALPTSAESVSIPEQIVAIRNAIAELVRVYQARLQEFQRLQDQVSELFDKLGVPVEERGEFAEIGTGDLSTERLQRYRSVIKSLTAESSQRKKLIASLKPRLVDLATKLEETLPEKLKAALDGDSITTETIQILNDGIDSLQKLSETRSTEIQSLNGEIDRLYSVLAVHPNDRIPKQTKNVQAVVNSLNEELVFLRGQSDARLPLVVKSATKEVSKLCDQLRIPLRMRPKFTGEGIEAEAIFLTRQIDQLREQQVRSQPIIDLITQIESCQSLLEGRRTHGVNQSPMRPADEQRAKQNARDLLLKLETKLLSLLLEFKHRHGYDFVFKGVKCLDTLASRLELRQTSVAVSPRRNSTTGHASQSPTSLGKEILLKKISQSPIIGYSLSTSDRAARRRRSLAARNPFA
jgi:predicted nuclease with TOPRIM domain